MRLGVSPTATPTPTGIFNQRFDTLFPLAGALGCSVCFAPLRSPPFVRFICARKWGRSACPALRHSESGPLGLSVQEWGATGSASGQTACPVRPTPRQSRSRHGHMSPSAPLLVWMNVYFLFPWCRTSLPFNFLSVLVVRGGSVCLPTPPSWFSQLF